MNIEEFYDADPRRRSSDEVNLVVAPETADVAPDGDTGAGSHRRPLSLL
jgi:hypothetical protein